MTIFSYQAIDLAGKTVSGQVDAGNARQARSQLKERGLLVDRLSELGDKHDRTRQRPIDGQTLMLLTRQWSTLLEAGLPMAQALAALIEQSGQGHVKQILEIVRQELLAGHSLHKALSSQPKSFPGLYCALIAAGERSGQLDRVMLRLADNLEQSGALRQRLIQALVYPCLVVLVATAVIAGLMTYVVPQVVGVFQSSKQALPLLTRLLILGSDLIRLLWPALLGALLLLIWGVGRAWRHAGLRGRLQERLLRLPILGHLLLALDSARLAQTLSILVGSGVPLLDALTAAGEVVWLQPVRTALALSRQEVGEGLSLHRALAKRQCFPPLLIHMIASGEASGSLDRMLDRAARQQADEVRNRLGLGMSLLEPALILGMGVMVLLIVLGILQPIIEINQLLR